MVIVGPRERTPSHHVSLSDGTRTLGLIITNPRGEAAPNAITRASVPRTALKTVTGATKYSDFEAPWTPVAQDDWSGGRGYEDFEKDTTKFWDNLRTNTMVPNMAILAGQETYTTGYRSQDSLLPGSVYWSALVPTSRSYLAKKFTASANYTITNIYVLVKRKGTPAADVTVELCVDDSGNPGGASATETITTSDITDVTSEFYKLALTTPLAVTAGTSYWVKVYSTNGTTTDHWMVGTSYGTGTSKESTTGSAWATSGVDLYYRCTDADDGRVPLFFRYKYAQYMFRNLDSGAPQLYINGDRGVADANTSQLTKLIDATKTWTVDQWKGCTVLIIKGLGIAEYQPWRTITANDATSLTVSPDWKITHDTTTEYVILGANTWTEIPAATHGITAKVTDVCVVNDICYVAQGDAVNMRRWRWYDNAGAATYEWADDGTNKAVKLRTVRDTDSGLVLWKANNADASGYVSVAKAPIVAWGTNLTFATAITFQDQWGRITSLVEYDDPKKLWIFREGTVNAASGTTADEISLSEIHSTMEYTNGMASLVHNVYMYFGMGSGIERYYNKLMEDMGPNRDAGLPEDMRGVVSCMVGYPGRFFAAYNGGADNYSSIYGYNGTGWNNIYRSPAKGQQIWHADFQTVPYVLPDRLWVGVGSDIIWITFPSMTMNPLHDSNYRYVHEGHIVSGYITNSMIEIYKLYKDVKIFSEYLGDDCTIEVDYQLDDETTWTTLPDAFETSPTAEVSLGSGFGVQGKRIRYRVRMLTSDNSKTPKLKTVVIDNVSRVPVKYSFGMSYRVQDRDVDLRGDPEIMTASEKQAILDEWAANLTPLIMHANMEQFDGRQVFIDPASLTPFMEVEEGYIAKLTVVEA